MFVERDVSLQASYAFCQRIARTRARNFYYSFLLLSREQRDAILGCRDTVVKRDLRI